MGKKDSQIGIHKYKVNHEEKKSSTLIEEANELS